MFFLEQSQHCVFSPCFVSGWRIKLQTTMALGLTCQLCYRSCSKVFQVWLTTRDVEYSFSDFKQSPFPLQISLYNLGKVEILWITLLTSPSALFTQLKKTRRQSKNGFLLTEIRGTSGGGGDLWTFARRTRGLVSTLWLTWKPGPTKKTSNQFLAVLPASLSISHHFQPWFDLLISTKICIRHHNTTVPQFLPIWDPTSRPYIAVVFLTLNGVLFYLYWLIFDRENT